jgi:hypothetical protein
VEEEVEDEDEEDELEEETLRLELELPELEGVSEMAELVERGTEELELGGRLLELGEGELETLLPLPWSGSPAWPFVPTSMRSPTARLRSIL